MSLPPTSVEKMNRAVVVFLDGRRKGYLFIFRRLRKVFGFSTTALRDSNRAAMF